MTDASGSQPARAVGGAVLRAPWGRPVAARYAARPSCCAASGLYEEIARALDTSVAAVKSLVHRATVSAAEALAPVATLPLRKEALP
jgi:hypothetical protein